MLRHSRLSNSRSGVAAVETAVILPFLAIMMIGLWEVGQLIETQQLLTNAAREGARRAATGASTGTYTAFYADIQNLCTNYLSAAGVTTTGINVSVSDLTSGGGPNFNPTTANQGDQLLVVVTIPFNNVRWVLIPQMFPANANISGSACWSSMVDKPVTVTLTLPTG